MIKSTINQFLNWHNKLCLFEQANSGFGLDDQEQASEKRFRSAMRRAGSGAAGQAESALPRDARARNTRCARMKQLRAVGAAAAMG